MANKNKNYKNNRPKNKSTGMAGNPGDALRAAGIPFNDSKPPKEESHTYANYDPLREEKRKNFRGGRESQRGSYSQGDKNSQRERNFQRGSYSQGDRNFQGDRNSQGGKNSRGGRDTGKNRANYLTPLDMAPHAPYNFVRISDHVMEAPKPPVQNRIVGGSQEDCFYTGYISYRMTAQTPIMAGSGERKEGGKAEEFYRDKDGHCAIPGSTVRGLIRSNAQILSFSRVVDDIDDYNLMYRAVASGCQKDEYGAVLGQKNKVINDHQMTILENVRAGYIRCEGNRYIIYRNMGDFDGSFTDSEANYYTVSEHYVLDHKEAKDNFEELLDDFHNKERKDKDKFETEKGKSNFRPYPDKYDENKMHYKGDERDDYVPYSYEITYALSDKNKVSGIRKAGSKKGALKKKGYVISSGKMGEKKAFYVIPEIDESHSIEVPEASVRAFQIDYNRRENSLGNEKKVQKNIQKIVRERTRKFFQLPKDGETRPVFYIELGGRLYFGYTPRLRLMYDHTIREGIRQSDKSTELQGPGDYVESMFGYTDEKGASALKSRVFFTNAVLQGKEHTLDSVNLVLGEPKPTSYLEYLEQTQGETVRTYNSDDLRLRGLKQYWLQDKETKEGKSNGNENISTPFLPLDKNSVFTGTVRFRNLTGAELGLLIWSIRLDKDSQLNIGKAKPYGYGRIKVDDVRLCLEQTDSLYSADISSLSAVPFEKQDDTRMDGFVGEWVKLLERWLKRVSPRGEADARKTPTLQDFFFMKSFVVSSESGDAEYMALSKKENKGEKRPNREKGYREYKQYNNPLPTVEQFRKAKK